jgi:hypothetical protein
MDSTLTLATAAAADETTNMSTSTNTASTTSTPSTPQPSGRYTAAVYRLFSNSVYYNRAAIDKTLVKIIQTHPEIISAYQLYDTVVYLASEHVSFNTIRSEMTSDDFWVKLVDIRTLDGPEEVNRAMRSMDRNIFNRMLARLCGAYYPHNELRGVEQSARVRMLTLGQGYESGYFTPRIYKTLGGEGIYVMNRELDSIMNPSHILCTNSLRTQIKYDVLEESDRTIDIVASIMIGVLSLYLWMYWYAINMSH